MTVLVVDNGSPYVKDLISYLEKIVEDYIIKKYDEEFLLSSYDRVILSGRQKNKKEINVINSKIIKFCFNNEKPLLGICYGAEIIALTFGGTICKTDYVYGLNRIIIDKPSKLLEDRYCYAYESHSYVISHLPDHFVHIASSPSCKYEIFCNESKKIFGTQFHPEKSGKCGLVLIRNFVNL